jgi:hypothetical protein
MMYVLIIFAPVVAFLLWGLAIRKDIKSRMNGE